MKNTALLNKMLKNTRIEQNLSCSQLARIANYSVSYINQLENNQINGTEEAYRIIFKALKIDYEAFEDLTNEVSDKLMNVFNSLVHYNLEEAKSLMSELHDREEEIIKTAAALEYRIIDFVYHIYLNITDFNYPHYVNYIESSISYLTPFYLKLSYDALALYYKSQRETERAEQYLFTALKIVNFENDQALLGMIHYHLSVIFENNNKLSSALEYNNQALNIFVHEKNIKRQLFAQVHNANIYSRVGEYELAKSKYKKLIKNFKSYDLQGLLPTVTNNAIWNAIKMKDYDGAFELIEDVLAAGKKNSLLSYHQSILYYYLDNKVDCQRSIDEGKEITAIDSIYYHLLCFVEILISDKETAMKIEEMLHHYGALKERVDNETKIILLRFITEEYKKVAQYKRAVQCLEEINALSSL